MLQSGLSDAFENRIDCLESVLLEEGRQLERNDALDEIRYVGQVRDWRVTLQIVGTQALFFNDGRYNSMPLRYLFYLF